MKQKLLSLSPHGTYISCTFPAGTQIINHYKVSHRERGSSVAYLLGQQQVARVKGFRHLHEATHRTITVNESYMFPPSVNMYEPGTL
jgi:hypothetical protein